jgi:hypothetical protein
MAHILACVGRIDRACEVSSYRVPNDELKTLLKNYRFISYVSVPTVYHNRIVQEEDSCKGNAKVVYEQYHEPGQLQRLGVSYEYEHQVLTKSPGGLLPVHLPCLPNFSEVNVRLGGMVFAVSGWATASQIACIIPPSVHQKHVIPVRDRNCFATTLQAFPTCSSSLGSA